MMHKPYILLVNDDGIFAPGLHALSREIKKVGEIAIVAPNTQQSAVGHAITVKDPLRVEEYYRNNRFFGYQINGTPADCVKLALRALLPRTPDLVVSGINQGANTALNIIYSGTVSAATEGTIYDIPSFSISLTSSTSEDFSVAASFARRLVRLILKNGLPEGTCLNVNVPPISLEKITGVRITRQGKGKFVEEFDKRQDPANRTYYWLKGVDYKKDTDDNTDEHAIRQNAISITPIHYDLTDYKMLETLKNWRIDR